MNTDKHIIDFLNWCHANPITVGIVGPIVAYVVKKTKNKLDDYILKRVVNAIGKD